MIHVCECQSCCIAEPRGVWRTPFASAADLFSIGLCVCCLRRLSLVGLFQLLLRGSAGAMVSKVVLTGCGYACASCALPPAHFLLRSVRLPR